jgi:hypothetical protein
LWATALRLARDTRESVQISRLDGTRWHEAREVTAAEWGRLFPEKSWVNIEALQLLDTQ